MWRLEKEIILINFIWIKENSELVGNVITDKPAHEAAMHLVQNKHSQEPTHIFQEDSFVLFRWSFGIVNSNESLHWMKLTNSRFCNCDRELIGVINHWLLICKYNYIANNFLLRELIKLLGNGACLTYRVRQDNETLTIVLKILTMCNCLFTFVIPIFVNLTFL